MESSDSSQHLMLVSGHCIKAAFKYPKYLPMSDQSLLKNNECDVNCKCVSCYVRRLNSLQKYYVHQPFKPCLKTCSRRYEFVITAIFSLDWPDSQVNFSDFDTNKWQAMEGDL